jgi:hypothetical protein
MKAHHLIVFSVTLYILFLSSACSPRTFSLVPDKSQYVLLEEEGRRELLSTLMRNRSNQRGSTIHTLLARSTLRSTSFEQALLFTEDSYRISLYTPNFSKLLYFAVATPDGTLSCDVSNKEAVISEDPAKIYLPELPPMLLNPENFKQLVLGEVPGSLLGEEGFSALEIRISIDDQGSEKHIVMGRIDYGTFEGLLVRIDNSLHGDSSVIDIFRLEKVILRPDNSKEAVQVEYFYSPIQNVYIPSEIRLYTLERSLDITFNLKKMSNEISGIKESLFSLQPPRGYQIYVSEQ